MKNYDTTFVTLTIGDETFPITRLEYDGVVYTGVRPPPPIGPVATRESRRIARRPFGGDDAAPPVERRRSE